MLRRQKKRRNQRNDITAKLNEYNQKRNFARTLEPEGIPEMPQEGLRCPHWTTVRPVNLPGNQATIKVDNDILRAPTIIYPEENAELPLADLILKWKFEWNDIRGKPYMELKIEDSDGQRVVLESWVNNEGKNYSFTIPKSRLVSGKTYKVKLLLRFHGVTQTTRSSFIIK